MLIQVVKYGNYFILFYFNLKVLIAFRIDLRECMIYDVIDILTRGAGEACSHLF